MRRDAEVASSVLNVVWGAHEAEPRQLGTWSRDGGNPVIG